MPYLAMLSMLKKHTQKSSSSTGLASVILRVLLRFFQFVMAITVAALYGIDVHHAHQDGKSADPRWVYAEVVAGSAAVTVLVYAIPFVKSFKIFAWDGVVCLLYSILTGIFGMIYVKAKAEDNKDNSGLIRMKHAVYVDAVNLALWFSTAVLSAMLFFRERKNRGEKNHAVV